MVRSIPQHESADHKLLRITIFTVSCKHIRVPILIFQSNSLSHHAHGIHRIYDNLSWTAEYITFYIGYHVVLSPSHQDLCCLELISFREHRLLQPFNNVYALFVRSLLIAVVNSISFTSISFACVEFSEPSPLFFHIIEITCECVPLTVTTCLHDTFVCLILQYLIMKDIIEYFSMCLEFFNINRVEMWLLSDRISNQEIHKRSGSC